MEPGALKRECPKRLRIAFALVLSALLLSQLLLVINPPLKLPPGMRREVAQYGERFSEVRNFLPRSGVIGYLSDPRDSPNGNESLYVQRYLSAEYQLAPLIIADSTQPEIILGNFFSPGGMEKAAAGRHWIVLHDFHNGVLLLRK